MTQHARGTGRHQVEIAVEGDGPRRTADVSFAFTFARADEEDMRWYLEEYLLYPHEPARVVARIEQRIAQIGEELFGKIFAANDDSRDRWVEVRGRLSRTRVEIVTDLDGASEIPWELLRDPRTAAPLAVAAHSFVRAHPAPVVPSRPASRRGKVRILLVLCRPAGGKDVAFRSVASRIVKGLSEADREAFDLVLLRPPTFERLSDVLYEAHNAGTPFHVVHFDGHGGYFDLEPIIRTWKERPAEEAERALLEAIDLDPRRFSPQALYPHQVRPGLHSYLLFENPTGAENRRLVDGPELGKLLVSTGVSALVLNAYRSAYARSREDVPGGAPEANAAEPPSSTGEPGVETTRSWATLAQEVMEAGVPRRVVEEQ